MKTANYNLDVMLPMQIGKEIIFNESQRFFDAFCNFAISGAVETLPENPAPGGKYIKSGGEHNGNIFYWDEHSEKWINIAPKEGMIFYVIQEAAFFIFHHGAWKRLKKEREEEKSSQQKIFISTGEKYKLESSTAHYLYLDSDCEIECLLPEGESPAILIIKQNVDTPYKINWGYNILWPDKNAHEVSSQTGAIDVIEIFPLVEGSYFVARVFGKNYQY